MRTAATVAMLCMLAFVVACGVGPSDKNNPAMPVDSPEEKPKPVVFLDPPPPVESPPAVPEWVDASNAVAKIGDIEIQIDGAKWRRPRVRLGRTESVSPVPIFVIDMTISNTSETRIVDFSTWCPRQTVFKTIVNPDRQGSLEDSFGNRYAPFARPYELAFVGQFEDKRIRPGQRLSGILIFEQPLMKTEWLQLELDAGAFSGCSGRFLLRIPGKMIDWGEGAPPPKKSAADIKREEDQARAAAKLRAEAKLQRERAEREEMERAAAAQAKRAAQQAKEEKEAEEARILEAKAKADALKMAKAEASSTEWLRAIRKMIEQDKIETAIKRLKYVLEEFPGTTGAAEAAKLLKELDK